LSNHLKIELIWHATNEKREEHYPEAITTNILSANARR
jgi:hypothetical protein